MLGVLSSIYLRQTPDVSRGISDVAELRGPCERSAQVARERVGNSGGGRSGARRSVRCASARLDALKERAAICEKARRAQAR